MRINKTEFLDEFCENVKIGNRRTMCFKSPELDDRINNAGYTPAINDICEQCWARVNGLA